MTVTAHDFARQLEEAFGALPLPAPSTLVAASYRRFDDSTDLAHAFAGQHWRDLSPQDLHVHRSGLVGLSDVGFPFILPAYLRAALPDERSPWWSTGDVLVWTLMALAPARPTDEDRASFQARPARFTEVQREAVRTFLRAVAATEEPPSSLTGVLRRGGWGV